LLLLALLCLPAAAAGEDYLLATAGTGGTYYPVGVAIATLVKLKLGEAAGIRLSAINSAGSAENIKLLANNEVQFGILQGLYGHFLWEGSGPIEALGPQRRVRAVSGLWSNVEHFLVDADARRSGTVADLRQLKGQRAAFGKRNSGAIESNRWLLGNLGLQIDRDFALVYSGYGASADAMQNGRIVAMSAPAGIPNGAVTRLLAATGGRVAMLGFSRGQAARADGGLGIWQSFVIPAGTYPRQDRPLATIAQKNFLAVRADVDAQTVYLITKTIHENLPFLRTIHGAMKSVTPEQAVNGLAVPLHPGAARYYREAGILGGDPGYTPEALQDRI